MHVLQREGVPVIPLNTQLLLQEGHGWWEPLDRNAAYAVCLIRERKLGQNTNGKHDVMHRNTIFEIITR